MAQYRSITLPPAGVVRGIMLAAVHAQSAVVWQRSDGSHVESRASWSSPPEGPDPAALTETPADPAALGWTRLTPAPT